MSYICEKIVLSENGEKEYFVDNDGSKTISFDKETLSTMMTLGFEFENLDTESGWMPNKEKLNEMMMIREALLKYKHYLDRLGKQEVVFAQVQENIVVGIKTNAEFVKGLPIAVCCSNTTKMPCIKLSHIVDFEDVGRFVTVEIPDDMLENQEKVNRYIERIMLRCANTYEEYNIVQAKKEQLHNFAEKTKDYFLEKTKLFFREDNVTGTIKESGKCLLIEIRVQNEIIDRVVFRFLMYKFGWNVKTDAGYFQIKKKASEELQTYLKSKKMCFRLPEDIEKWVRMEYDELLYDTVTQYHIFRLTDASGIITEDKYEEFKNIIRELEKNLELS